MYREHTSSVCSFFSQTSVVVAASQRERARSARRAAAAPLLDI